MNERDRQERRLRRIEGFLYRISVFRHSKPVSQTGQKHSFFIGPHRAQAVDFASEDLKKYRKAHRN
ncbi:hypothetical protein B4O97_10395 [Marispirochaeta aestuarii]|uniref:Uncharacterized protein n=1 Tax=Marispirochaeta aestuarii TaxID=1963862 RepID=A0A1Y1RXN4_9SPIO|nr:hypothetical protein B4O97_10395 [Marispirochaeta aestuarii]